MATKWITEAIKRPGALRTTAKTAGAINPDGTINKAWLKKMAGKGSTKTAQQARLATTLDKLR